MPAARWNIVLEEQSDFVLNVSYELPKGVAVDVTSYGALFEIRDDREHGVPYVSCTVGSGITLDGLNGQFQIRVESATIDAIAVMLGVNWKTWRGQWDLLIWPSLALPEVAPLRLVEGSVRYEKAVALTT